MAASYLAGACHARSVPFLAAALAAVFRHPRPAARRRGDAPGPDRRAMTLAVHYLVLAAFAGLMAVAAFEDFRRLTIPNWVTLSACLLWPAYFVASPSWHGALAALGCAVAVFLVGAVLFARGYLGGGDVKLLAAGVLWAGPSGTPALLILTGIFGGVLALILLSPLGAYLVASTRLQSGAAAHSAVPGSTPVPYGIAIAGAALSVILPPQFS
jgi:prepilin peptidase CpaA